MIPGEDLQLPEAVLLQNIGKYLLLYEHSERKRMVLAQAYNELKAKYEPTDAYPEPVDEGGVIQGMP